MNIVVMSSSVKSLFRLLVACLACLCLCLCVSVPVYSDGVQLPSSIGNVLQSAQSTLHLGSTIAHPLPVAPVALPASALPLNNTLTPGLFFSNAGASVPVIQLPTPLQIPLTTPNGVSVNGFAGALPFGSVPSGSLPEGLPAGLGISLSGSLPIAGPSPDSFGAPRAVPSAVPALGNPAVYAASLGQPIPGLSQVNRAFVAPVGNGTPPQFLPGPGASYSIVSNGPPRIEAGQFVINPNTGSAPSQFALPGGSLLSVRSPAIASVTSSNGITRIVNLNGTGKNVVVKLPTNQVVAVAPGFELVTGNRSLTPADILTADGIARRDAVLINGGSLGVAEVSLPSVLKNTSALASLVLNPVNDQQKKLSNQLLKSVAALTVLRGNQGFDVVRNIVQAVTTIPAPLVTVPPIVRPILGGTGGAGAPPQQLVTGQLLASNSQPLSTADASRSLQSVGQRAPFTPITPLNAPNNTATTTDATRALAYRFGTEADRKPVPNAAKSTTNKSASPAQTAPGRLSVPPWPPNRSLETLKGVHGDETATQPERRRSLASAIGAHHSTFPALPKSGVGAALENEATALKEAVQQHPDIALAAFALVLLLLALTIYLARTAHLRAAEAEAASQLLRVQAEELTIARDQALQASLLKNEFVANISHEIRTPMTAVLGTINLLFDTELDNEQSEIAHVLKDSARGLLGIINDILDFSKIEAGKLHLENVEFAPHAVVKEVAELLSGSAREKNLKLRTDVATDVPSNLRGDPARVRQILVNLAGNAIKFTEAGEVSMSVAVEAVAGAKTILRFTVKDSGIGIPLEAAGRLFHAFVQADGSTTRRFGGTGLGLSISRSLAELMGGTIDFKSTVGQGSEFWLLVPFDLIEPAPAVVTAPSPQAKTLVQPPVDRRILVAEDNGVLQRIITKQLEKLNYPVDVVDNGVDAVSAITSGAYALVLMDWQMPQMDGLAATKSVRALDSRQAHIPIVAMTANAMESDKLACLAAGMDDYISKPFSVEQLRTVIDRWMPQADDADS